jgi:hypothetical protein
LRRQPQALGAVAHPLRVVIDAAVADVQFHAASIYAACSSSRSSVKCTP